MSPEVSALEVVDELLEQIKDQARQIAVLKVQLRASQTEAVAAAYRAPGGGPDAGDDARPA